MKIRKIAFIAMLAAMVAILAVPASAAINDGLWDYYPFDDNASDALDNNNLDLKRPEQIVNENAPCGKGFLSVKGADDVLALIATDAYGPFFDDNKLTIALWIRLDTAKESGWSTILGFGTGANYDYFRFIVDPADSSLYFYFQSTNYTYAISYPKDGRVNLRDGNWHHVGFTAEFGSVPVFYIDGKPYDTVNDPEISKFLGDPTGGYFVLGAMNDLVVDAFSGDMDDLRVYTRVLSENEFQELYAMKGTTPEMPETTEPIVDTDPPATSDVPQSSNIPDNKDSTSVTELPVSTEQNDSAGEKGNEWMVPVVVIAAIIVVGIIIAGVIVEKKRNK